MVMGKRNPVLLATVYGLALCSVLVTRLVKAFTLAEGLAVAAFLVGLILLWQHRREEPPLAMGLTERLVVVASVIGLMGLPIKLLFVLFGVGSPAHDMARHTDTGGNPLLLHIHHVFFNLGFLVLLISGVAWIAARKDSRGT